MNDAENRTPTFATRLKQARTERGMTRLTLSSESGVNMYLIKNYEHGVNLPRLDNLVALAQALECSTDHLCGLEE